MRNMATSFAASIRGGIARRIALLLCVLACAIGCGPVPPEADEPEVGSLAQEIVVGPNTIEDTDVNPRWPQVVRVCGGGRCCSGTLVSRVHVLTAGHCLIPSGGTVNLDTPAGAGSGSGRRAYRVVRTRTMSSTPFSGSDLALLLLDEAVPSFGTQGSPEYSVKPARAFAPIYNNVSIWTIGYGYGNDCAYTDSGIRRGLRYLGGFRTYSAFPGVITRVNLPCDDPNKGPSPGDSGGPLLNVTGQVVGVFSGWSCRDATGQIGGSCSGTIEWSGLSPANTAWLDGAMAGDFDGDGIADVDDPRPNLNCTGSSPPAACASLKPDFEVTNIAAGGCGGPGVPLVAVTVRNNGPVAGSTRVDLFAGLLAPPSVGTLSSNFRTSRVLQMRETQTLWIAVDAPASPTWIDVIVDTTRTTSELNESNNVRSARISLPDCYLP